MVENYKKIGDIVEITEIKTKTINLKDLQNEIDELTLQANNLKFIDYFKIKGLTQEIIEVLEQENAKRDEQKSYFLEMARMKQEELDKYN